MWCWQYSAISSSQMSMNTIHCKRVKRSSLFERMNSVHLIKGAVLLCNLLKSFADLESMYSTRTVASKIPTSLHIVDIAWSCESVTSVKICPAQICIANEHAALADHIASFSPLLFIFETVLAWMNVFLNPWSGEVPISKSPMGCSQTGQHSV